MNIFEAASRKQLRFTGVGSKGSMNTEDLWGLKLEDLDTLARGYNKSIKDLDEESFITKRTTANTELNLKFEIVKHVINVRLEEQEKKKLAKERAEKRAQLIDLIGKKELTALESKSIEELRGELAQLDEV